MSDSHADSEAASRVLLRERLLHYRTSDALSERLVWTHDYDGAGRLVEVVTFQGDEPFTRTTYTRTARRASA